MKLLIEATVVGFVFLLLFKVFYMKNINIRIFLIGFLGHLLFEVTKLNLWYCKNGNACQ